ncbi:site-2 protease family protein [Clostridium baratii]|uniref:Peptidase M50 family protein n=1 Tax=Clostridium baratii str. Sullivan TaxID=1415775 RepID=A0A0A7G076_9CLOT|nr:site-2 protease family protein [Clostridium baratii]AIY84486.1 peptidase M50 family protein [Clostridium baratii str. Sullivan]MDU1052862.1 site-2 protease family protein [Clostridium baratii]MDU4912305.1 site-2 protease family protein [Clostridium baratii]CUP22498.1 peptidase M50 [Clostridium baratii]
MGYIYSKILMIPAILLGFTFHEYAHAKMADKLGDKTARFQGRLNLNPLTHIDALGFLMILVAGIGWAKPVQVNPAAFKDKYKDDLKVSLAGPLANLVVALFGGILLFIVMALVFSNILTGALSQILHDISIQIIYINVMLFIFNLLPLPGLDGWSVFRDLSPKHFYRVSDKVYQYQFIILLAIVVVGAPIISIPVKFISTQIINIVQLLLMAVF